MLFPLQFEEEKEEEEEEEEGPLSASIINAIFAYSELVLRTWASCADCELST